MGTADSGVGRVYIPFTVVSDGDNLQGAQNGYPPLLNGEYSPIPRIDYNFRSSDWGVYNGTTLVSTAIGIATNYPAYSILPDGIYTSDDRLQLNYYAPGDPNRLISATALNSFAITVGDEPQNNAVPEPATMVLLGTGLVGMVLRRRRA